MHADKRLIASAMCYGHPHPLIFPPRDFYLGSSSGLQYSTSMTKVDDCNF